MSKRADLILVIFVSEKFRCRLELLLLITTKDCYQGKAVLLYSLKGVAF